MIRSIQFYVKTFINGRSIILPAIRPVEINKVFEYYINVCQNIREFDLMLNRLYEQKKLNKPTVDLGRNDSSLLVYGEKTILNCEFVSGIPPLEVPTNDVIAFFAGFKEFFLKYEECEIPGIIPESKLDSWSCVPNEYVKPEYREKVKKEKGDGEEV